MKYALNIKKGTTFNHPQAGSFKGGIARQIEDRFVPVLKSFRNIVIFEGFE